MRVVSTEDSGQLDLRGHTLVVPGCGGIAQLGELCVDALISSYGMDRVAIAESRHLIPLAMPSAWKAPDAKGVALPITTSAELYQSKAAPSVSILQLRSPTVEGRRKALARDILAWARSVGVSSVLVLASCSAHVRVDADLRENSELRCLSSSSSTVRDAGAVLPLGHSLSEEELGGPCGSAAAARLLLRGSGLARSILLAAAEESLEASSKTGTETFDPPFRAGAVSVDCLMAFTNDVLDWRLPEQLTKAACSRLESRHGVKTPEMKPPASWRFSMQAEMLFGTDPRLW
eukprot:TRINITY_DN22136_c0_g1_i1.p1 TRINITY_DN22136_c0_g1~~TRINITY_DN22136_c0_g1_i1.p1  ORF type:complete len:290 (-),score=52.08 TRINITY_DN22136_c0_g1_i1:106-975(-)